MNRYYGVSDYLKKRYGEKLVKLSLDGGFTCPNRDGTYSSEGCIFCSERGSGEFAGSMEAAIKSNDSFTKVEDQLHSQMALLEHKWPNHNYIAYFQNYTNTYKPIDELKELYDRALNHPKVKALAIATRPDCIEPKHVELMHHYPMAWVELGLQTIHDEKAKWLNRHYDLQDFERAFYRLKEANIPVVVHLIVGLPGETKGDFIRSVQYLSRIQPAGVKFHMLNVLKHTGLERQFHARPFELLSLETYIDWICDAIEWLDPEIAIHRLTGDGEKNALIAPQWILNKRAVLNGINKCLVARNTHQGIRLTM